MQIPRCRICTSAGTVVLLAASLLVANGEKPREPGFPAGIRLTAKARGEDAIAALGSRLPDVAGFYGRPAQQLREVFRADPSLWVAPDGELLFACPLDCTDSGHAKPAEAGPVAENIGPTDPTPFDTSQAFLLHSRPGANRVIYLDFDGHADASGKWKSGAESPPFDLDGNAATFNSTELNRIIGIWQRVAEDYAMVEIDVTTEDPGIGALGKSNSGDAAYGVRVVIGGSSSDWYGSGSGGVAFVGSFDSKQDVPCWVFSKSLGNSEKSIAEAASHEAGHTLGLLHDGVTGGASYYGGQGDWAPIMGASYGKAISQWSKGEYANSNNTQDDLAVMLTHGAAYRPDDHGGGIATATGLSADVDSVAASGVIERNTDMDFFRVDAVGGSLVVIASPSPCGPDLRLEVKLYDAAGVPLQTAASADTNAGTQPVSLSRTVAAGAYYISVDGIGNGDPLTTGYSDYASLGQYNLSVTGVVPGGSTWLPVAAGNHQWNQLANWSSGNLPSGAGSVVRINNDITGDQTIQLASPTALGRLFLGDSNSTHSFAIASSVGPMVFDNNGTAAELSKTAGAGDVISAPVQLASDLILTQSASGTLGFIGGISGAGSLTKDGAGTVVFGSSNSYTGATTLNDGLLRLDDAGGLPGGIDNAVGAGESALVFKGGVLGLASGDFTRQLGTGAGQLQWTGGSGGFAAFGADREVRLNNGTGALSWNSAIIGGGNMLIFGHPAATHTVDFKNGIAFAGSKRTILIEHGQADVDAILSGVLSGGGASGLNKTGNGVLSLNNANSYPGSTTVNGGMLRLQNAGALPGGNLELTGGGILGLGAGDLTSRTPGTGVDQVQWTGEGGFAAFGAERAVKFSESSINWNASNFIGGARALILGHDTADATLDWRQNISLAGSTRVIQVNDGYADIDAKMSGIVSGGVTDTYTNFFNKTGAGTLAFTAQNTYRGDTIVSFGTLMIGDGGAAGGVSKNTQSIFVDSGATLAVNRSDTVTQGTDAFKAAISGDGGFSQMGTGNTVLALANTHTGQTSVTAGTLTLAADHVLPEASAVLLGNAALDAATFSNSMGTLTIGDAATIHFGSGAALSFANSGAIDWSAGTLTLTGTFVSGASLRLGSNAGGLTSGQLARISINGEPGHFALDADGYLINGYPAWKIIHAPGQSPDDDFDGDGVANGVEYLLGGGKHRNDLDKLPTVSASNGDLVFTFVRDQLSIDGTATVEIQVSPDLTDWSASYPVPGSAATDNPGVTVVKDTPAGFDTVTLKIPLAPNGKFARLKVTP